MRKRKSFKRFETITDMILVLAEQQNGRFRKSSYEIVYFGKKLGESSGQDCCALVLGEVGDAGQLGLYGADKVLQIADPELNELDTQQYVAAIRQVFEGQGAGTLVLPHSTTGKAIAGRLAVALDASVVTAVNELPQADGDFRVNRPVFAGKAIATFQLEGERKVITVTGNSLQPQEIGAPVQAEQVSVDLPARKVTVREVRRAEGKTPLPEAELVVSAGRGMKGPESWGIIEELAEALGASTACSRPVSDADWRPHHEHVGQTGIAIRPNLYLAVGISGAIQHLAGVNNSKVIVVVNKDPEAPFFKAADYGVVADLFDVVPRLTEAVKKFRAEG